MNATCGAYRESLAQSHGAAMNDANDISNASANATFEEVCTLRRTLL